MWFSWLPWQPISVSFFCRSWRLLSLGLHKRKRLFSQTGLLRYHFMWRSAWCSCCPNKNHERPHPRHGQPYRPRRQQGRRCPRLKINRLIGHEWPSWLNKDSCYLYRLHRHAHERPREVRWVDTPNACWWTPLLYHLTRWHWELRRWLEPILWVVDFLIFQQLNWRRNFTALQGITFVRAFTSINPWSDQWWLGGSQYHDHVPASVLSHHLPICYDPVQHRA